VRRVGTLRVLIRSAGVSFPKKRLAAMDGRGESVLENAHQKKNASSGLFN
jgi:hypothetical protein